MALKRATMSFSVLAAVSAIIGLSPVMSGSANAAENCSVGVGSYTVQTVYTSNGASTITLKYDPNTHCAWATVNGVPNRSEVWLDRRDPYQGMVGGVRVANGNGYGGTDTWSMYSKFYRACGTNGSGTAIVCTNWH